MSLDPSELISSLIEKGEDLIDDKGEDWLDKAIEEGGALLDSEVDGDLAKAGHDALEHLAANKEPFVRLGKVGFAFLVGHWANDDEAEAKRRYLETQATFDERRSAMHAAGDAAAAERREREDAWDVVVGVLKAIGKEGMKFLVKFLIATLLA